MAVTKRKLKSGKIKYRAYWRNPYTGKIETGSWTSEGKAEKESDAVAFRLKHERETFLPKRNPIEKGGLPVIDLLGLYTTKANLTDSTRDRTFHHAKDAAIFFADDMVADLTPEKMVAFEQFLSNKGNKQNTISRKVCIITGAITWAKKKKIIEARPFHSDDYKCESGKNKTFAPLTPIEIRRVMDVAAPHVKRAIFINYLTGARTGPSELLSMTWDDFFFDERFVRVHSAEKNRDIPWRDIPVDDDSAWDLFASWRDEDTAQGILFVISYCGKPIKRFTGAWRRTLKRAGIKRKLPPYSLRHSFVTELLKSGADLKTTSEMAGHSDVGTTVRIYQHTTELMRKQAARKLPTIPVDANDEAPKKKTEDSRYTGEVYKSPKNDPLLYTSKNKLQ